MFEMYGKNKVDYHDTRQGSGASYKPYSRAAVAKKRKKANPWGLRDNWRGVTGTTKLSLPSGGGNQPIGARPTSTKPTDSLSRQRWFQT